ncbi:lysophospholipid acyltransferase family protein [Deinococcus cellulosilyticus]|uniref:1-acyl-sn-glycerol-3-phosphate acyltransferase n=1 Tax=Deinococcus cellulosilyticus (strain DSM 18568 / NBRC 106333 / KACC 11606 / 5516J-15) TaxID=1223518 RepID=A0A511N6P2_DEIC1|nr:lysophospholipid acyltransferase family protein [Deinococcus cellulosilyticus]GEM48514.1 1-acyl-sn-glycerol-3-phosphate acyltransferase [Deinococcus cellulosilyticus NBRC 106333 = KACC 11606]
MGSLLEIFFKTVIRHTLRKGLRGVYLRGTLQTASVLLVPNHHSWWDGYVMGELCWHASRKPALLMLDRQLQKYPFLKSVGAISHLNLREALQALKSGRPLILFPEGAMRPAGPVKDLRPGVKWFARHSGCEVVPVALRVVLRGHQHPEAYISLGVPCAPAEVGEAINRLLAELDGALLVCDPETPLAGYQQIMRGVGSDSERLNLASLLLKKLLRLG